MKQRVPRRAWYSPGGPGHRPRVLVESDSEALAVSDFSIFQQAGFDVAFCSGPGDTTEACHLLRGQECPVLAAADVVLHGLDPALGIAAAIRRTHPDIPVVAEQRHYAEGSEAALPDGCQPLQPFCSVPGQVEALRAALASRRATPKTS
jgi:CheY-like chemotaxis protein